MCVVTEDMLEKRTQRTVRSADWASDFTDYEVYVLGPSRKNLPACLITSTSCLPQHRFEWFMTCF